MDLALQSPSYRSDLGSAFSEWSVWNYFTGSRHDDTYYPEGDRYPLISEIEGDFTAPTDTLSDSLPPLSTRYHQVSSAGPPLELIAVNLDVNEAAGGGNAQRLYSYFLHSERADPLYEATAAGIFVKASVDDPFEWQTWTVVAGTAVALGTELPPVTTGVPFPDPFSPEQHRSINIPVGMELQAEVDLHIFSSDLALVYSVRTIAVMERGQKVVKWNGLTARGEIAQTGVYVFAASGNGVLNRGKFALVRR
jgi:hypothetical protein